MKTVLKLLFLVSIVFTMSGCDDPEIFQQTPENIVKEVAQGKMILVVDNKDEYSLDCTYSHYGEGSEWQGEVSFNTLGVKEGTDEQITMNFTYGFYGNTAALTTQLYSTEDDLLSVASTFGGVSDSDVVTLTVTQIDSDNGVKGYFSGTLLIRTGSLPVKGAFWAIKGVDQ